MAITTAATLDWFFHHGVNIREERSYSDRINGMNWMSAGNQQNP